VTRALLLYGLAATAIALGAGLLLTLAFRGPGDAAAIRLSAIVVVVVQLVAFAIARQMGPKNALAGWGIGALLRFMTLVVYALIVAKLVTTVPLTAALVSMAALFFLTTLLEPLLLKR
jgi:hypothetical protein